MAKVEFKCDKCGKLLSLEAAGGEQVACTQCGGVLTVPRSLTPTAARPAPRVMGGVRPQVAGAPVAAAAPVAVGVEGPPFDEPPVGENSALVVMSALMPWAISIVFHLGLLLIMMFFTYLVVQIDDDAEDNLVVPSSKWAQDPGSKVLTKNREVEQYNTQRKVDMNKPAPDVMDKSAGRTSENITIAVPGGDSAAAGAGATSNLFSGGEAGGGAKFFGSESGGNVTKVVYVVDKSGSMFTTFPYVQQELVRSIKELKPKQQYQVVFFADRKPTELSIGGRSQLQYANTPNKRETISWVDDQHAASVTGTTDPREALDRAFKVGGGPPQLVYLLTDGLFPQETLDTIAKLNPDRKVRVNTIMFKDRTPEAERLLQKIASDNGGTYKFISEQDLGQDY